MDLTINEKIGKAGWYPGNQAMWDALPWEDRENLSFAATGCEVAYPTWAVPVNCVHTGCRIRRGEIPLIVLTNSILLSEIHSGWLRFHAKDKHGRIRLARLCFAVRNAARQTGIYDPWRLPGGWQAIVFTGIAS